MCNYYYVTGFLESDNWNGFINNILTADTNTPTLDDIERWKKELKEIAQKEVRSLNNIRIMIVDCTLLHKKDIQKEMVHYLRMRLN